MEDLSGEIDKSFEVLEAEVELDVTECAEIEEKEAFAPVVERDAEGEIGETGLVEGGSIMAVSAGAQADTGGESSPL